MKKKLLAAAAVLAVVLAVFLINNRLTYTVAPDCANLAEEAAKYWSRGSSAPWSAEDIQLFDSVTVGRQRFDLFEVGDKLGDIHLLRSFTGRWKISQMGRGDGNFREKIVEEDGDHYLLFGGRNAYFDIHTAKFEISGTIHVVEIPRKDRFLVAQDLMMRTSEVHVWPDRITFYDENGVDITAQVPWNGPME